MTFYVKFKNLIRCNTDIKKSSNYTILIWFSGCYHKRYDNRGQHQRAGPGHRWRKGCLGQVRPGDQQPRKRRLHQRHPIVEQITIFNFSLPNQGFFAR